MAEGGTAFPPPFSHPRDSKNCPIAKKFFWENLSIFVDRPQLLARAARIGLINQSLEIQNANFFVQKTAFLRLMALGLQPLPMVISKICLGAKKTFSNLSRPYNDSNLKGGVFDHSTPPLGTGALLMVIARKWSTL